MTDNAFGRRIVKQFTATGEQVATRVPAKARPKGPPMIDRALAWSSYLTLVFTSLVAFAPDATAAAVIGMRGMLAG